LLGSGRYAGSAREPELRRVGQALIDKLAANQTPDGGWAYYDWDPMSRRPTWATSFTTAAALLALDDARRQGLAVDQAMFERGVRAVRHCRLPSGAYTYSVEAVPDPRHSEWIDQIKGSLSRIQVCNLVLHRFDQGISIDDLKTGLVHFFRHHRFLDVARRKPIPHEAYYLNSGYFYLFGHYYAADVIALLPAEQQAHYWRQLQREIIKTQEPDGSMVDFFMHSYHKPYGVAYGLLALNRSLQRVDLERATAASPAATQSASAHE
jgi:hypothetical protein